MEQECRPFIQYTWLQLTALVQAHEDDIGKLQSILAELKYRKTKKAKRVYETVVEKINELQQLAFNGRGVGQQESSQWQLFRLRGWVAPIHGLLGWPEWLPSSWTTGNSRLCF